MTRHIQPLLFPTSCKKRNFTKKTSYTPKEKITKTLPFCHYDKNIAGKTPNLLLWVRDSKDSKVPHEPLAEFGDVSGGVWIDRGAVRHTVDVAPRVCVLVVEATVINVFSHQLHSRLLS